MVERTWIAQASVSKIFISWLIMAPVNWAILLIRQDARRLINRAGALSNYASCRVRLGSDAYKRLSTAWRAATSAEWSSNAQALPGSW